jgi:two-component system, NarL family, nitrate/nitrite response regulator NarL
MHILIVDDHEVLSVALAQYFENVGSTVIGAEMSVKAVHKFPDALLQVRSEDGTRPDLVFLDLNLDVENQGIFTFERFQKENIHNVPVVIYTGMSLAEPKTAATLLRCYNKLGAQSILLKSGNQATMLVGLPRILAGERWIPQDVLTALLEAAAATRKDNPRFSRTQQKVADCLTKGFRDQKIADTLGLSDDYVRQVLGIIYKKLGVHSRLEAALELEKLRSQDDSIGSA